jgi:ribosomal protein S18 acetylase RimI-like enzyme
MEIRDLSTTSIDEIIFAILMAFEGYFLTMPSDSDYWESRFQAARVDWNCSFGVFEEGELVAFIINGIDKRGSNKVAFNTGTGVVPSHRGQKWVDELYQYAFLVFQEKKITHCALEVLQENSRAIRVYERIGFSIAKDYCCFKGKLAKSMHQTTLVEVNWFAIHNPHNYLYAWDNSSRAIEKSREGSYCCYEVFNLAKEKIGFFAINANSGYLLQFEIYKTNQVENWNLLFDGIAQINRGIKINNVDAQRADLIPMLLDLGLENTVNQYEMEKILEPVF